MNKRMYLRFYCWWRALSLADKAKCVWFYTNIAIAMCMVDADVVTLFLFIENLAMSVVAIKTVPTEGIENIAE